MGEEHKTIYEPYRVKNFSGYLRSKKLLTQPVSTNSSFLGIEICYLQKRWKVCYFKIYSAIVKFLLDELSNIQYYGTLREMFSTRFLNYFRSRAFFLRSFSQPLLQKTFFITISEPISYESITLTARPPPRTTNSLVYYLILKLMFLVRKVLSSINISVFRSFECLVQFPK